jgi:hypothetical protein
LSAPTSAGHPVPPSLVGGAVVLDVELVVVVFDVVLVVDREALAVLEPDVAPVPLPDEDPAEVDPPPTPLVPLLAFEDADPPEALLDPPPAVLTPPRVELVVPVSEPGAPVFGVPDPPQAATMAAPNTTANVPPRNMPVQGAGCPHLRPTKRRRRG